MVVLARPGRGRGPRYLAGQPCRSVDMFRIGVLSHHEFGTWLVPFKIGMFSTVYERNPERQRRLSTSCDHSYNCSIPSRHEAIVPRLFPLRRGGRKRSSLRDYHRKVSIIQRLYRCYITKIKKKMVHFQDL